MMEFAAFEFEPVKSKHGTSDADNPASSKLSNVCKEFGQLLHSKSLILSGFLPFKMTITSSHAFSAPSSQFTIQSPPSCSVGHIMIDALHESLSLQFTVKLSVSSSPTKIPLIHASLHAASLSQLT